MDARTVTSRSPGLQSGKELAPVVFIVDDGSSALEHLARVIRANGWQVEFTASLEALLALPARKGPSCLILDAAGPQIHWLILQEVVVDRAETSIIFAAQYRDERTTVRAMKAGATCLHINPLNEDDLLRAVRSALDHSSNLLARIETVRVIGHRLVSLTNREREVMKLVVCGLLNKQIAAQLGISEITVKAHRGKMMRKMLAGSVPELVNMSIHLRIEGTNNGRSSPWPRSSASSAAAYAN